jgi:uncharacterized OB-fold protein
MWEKPLPQIDLDNKGLFEAYKDHEFKLYRCQECGDWYFPKTLCKNHDNDAYFDNIELETASGNGTIYTYATTHRLFHEGFEDDLPYTFAMIELEEGPLFGSQIIDTSEIEIGLPVEVSFRDIPAESIPEERAEKVPFDGGFTLPYFTATQEGDA